MSILGSLFGKNDESSRRGCCGASPAEGSLCGCCSTGESAPDGEAIIVKIVGTGCKKCRQLYENALEAAAVVDKAVRVEYITDLSKIAEMGVMTTPALIIDGRVVSAGMMRSSDEIASMLG